MPVRNYQKNGGGGSRRGKKEIPTARKTGVLSILMVATGLLLLLALVSYDPVDEARADIQFSDLWKVFSGDPEARAKADTTQNWLGLVGAMLSTFLIRSTIGYAVVVVPLLLIGWGWLVMRGKDLSSAVNVTNHVLVGALLFSTSLGMIRLIFGAEVLAMEWSGLVGDFVASVLTQLLGQAGGAIVLIVVILVTVIYVTGLDLGRLAARVRSGGLRMLDW